MTDDETGHRDEQRAGRWQDQRLDQRLDPEELSQRETLMRCPRSSLLPSDGLTSQATALSTLGKDGSTTVSARGSSLIRSRRALSIRRPRL